MHKLIAKRKNFAQLEAGVSSPRMNLFVDPWCLCLLTSVQDFNRKDGEKSAYTRMVPRHVLPKGGHGCWQANVPFSTSRHVAKQLKSTGKPMVAAVTEALIRVVVPSRSYLSVQDHLAKSDIPVDALSLGWAYSVLVALFLCRQVS